MHSVLPRFAQLSRCISYAHHVLCELQSHLDSAHPQRVYTFCCLTAKNVLDHFLAVQDIRASQKTESCQTPIHSIKPQMLRQPVLKFILFLHRLGRYSADIHGLMSLCIQHASRPAALQERLRAASQMLSNT